MNPGQKQDPGSIIRLNDEGALLECRLDFLAKVEGRRSEPKKRFQILPFTSLSTVEICKGNFMMFLGVRHFRSRKNEMEERRTQRVLKSAVDDVYRYRLMDELFRGPYYTSLKFLWGEKIVKVDWHGSLGLDQLAEASHFMYLHFSVPEFARG